MRLKSQRVLTLPNFLAQTTAVNFQNMSIRALTWAFDQDVKPATKKLTLIAMSDFANDQNECYPSVETLTNKTSLNRKTVMKNIAELVADGTLEDTGKRVGSTQQVKIYRININSPKNGTVPKTEQSRFYQSKSPVFTIKESQKRDTEPEGNHNQEPSEGERQLPSEAIIWNETCSNLPKALVVGGSRLRSLQARRRDPFWRENFKAACEKVSESNFCNGATNSDRAWVATFDWMLQPDTVPKVMEGKYDNRKPKAKPVASTEEDPFAWIDKLPAKP